MTQYSAEERLNKELKLLSQAIMTKTGKIREVGAFTYAERYLAKRLLSNPKRVFEYLGLTNVKGIGYPTYRLRLSYGGNFEYITRERSRKYWSN